MSAPGEHKTVQARILRYAQEIGWTFVPRAEAEARCGFKAEGVTPAEAVGEERCSSFENWRRRFPSWSSG